MPFRLEPASALSEAALSKLFNAGYAGYVMPVNVNEGYIAAHIHQQDVSLDHS